MIRPTRRRLAALSFAIVLAGCAARSPTNPVRETSAPLVVIETADVVPGAVRLVWHVDEGTGLEFQVQRRHGEQPWKFIAALEPDAWGRLALEDSGVSPGEPYAYRVAVLGAGDPAFSGFVEVIVPGP